MKKIIIFMVLMLMTIASVQAMSYHISASDFYDTAGGSCIVQNDSSCVVWRDWLSMQYRDDSTLFKRLSGEGLTSSSSSGTYKFYIEYKLVNASLKFVNAPNVTAQCYINEYVNGSTETLLDFTGGNSAVISTNYLEVKMKDGDQFTCYFDTIFDNNDNALSSNRWYFRYWLPTYETESAEPDRRTIIKLEAEVEELEAKITGEYQSTQDYILEVLKAVVKINFKLWVYMYWLLLISLVVGVFSLLIYILWWLYMKVKGIK